MPTTRALLSVPLPLEQYAHACDELFHTHIQRRRLREYLAGLLLPRDRNKSLTALVGAEPITQAQTAPVPQVQVFLSESDWDAEAVTTRPIDLLRSTPLTAPHAEGALVIDETGDRQAGTQTAHVGYQYLGSIGKTANGIVAVTSRWADGQVYYPLQVRPYTPAARFAGGKPHPAFRTKPQLALDLVLAARAADIPLRAVVADSLDGEHPEFKPVMWQADSPYVLAVKPSQIVWTPPPEPASPWEAADRLRWGASTAADHPAAWTAVARRFHDGHEETWWAVDLRLGSYAPEYPTRLVVATADPRTLPDASTWYLVPNLPLPGTARAAEHPVLPAAALAEVVRLYGLRQWVEQGDTPVKQELGWADFQGRSDRARRRHWALVCCAFAFCWWHERHHGDDASRRALPLPLPPQPGVGEKWGTVRDLTQRTRQLLPTALLPTALLATRTPPRAELA